MMYYLRYFYFFQTPWIPEIFTASRDNFIFNSTIKKAFKPNDSEQAVEAYKYYYSQPGIYNNSLIYYLIIKLKILCVIYRRVERSDKLLPRIIRSSLLSNLYDWRTIEGQSAFPINLWQER